MNQLYEPMLARDIEAIPRATREFRKTHSSEELFRSISRFALLAASPSQHGKHALLACVAAREIEPILTTRYDEVLTECAIYTAQSRLPWSEPPITDPPEVESNHPTSLQEIRAAIREKDRIRGQRWLAARLAQGSIARDFFTVAAEDLSDFGHKLIVAVGVWKLALMHGQPESYAFLRVAVSEWTAYGGESVERAPERRTADLVETMVAEQGALEAFHGLVRSDAAREAVHFESDPHLLVPSVPPAVASADLPVYRLARDYAEYLKSFAIAGRRDKKEQGSKIIAAAKYNRDHADSFEDWSFA